jgi:hypothetical protein
VHIGYSDDAVQAYQVQFVILSYRIGATLCISFMILDLGYKQSIAPSS